MLRFFYYVGHQECPQKVLKYIIYPRGYNGMVKKKLSARVLLRVTITVHLQVKYCKNGKGGETQKTEGGREGVNVLCKE
jgi:hypothetical protein